MNTGPDVFAPIDLATVMDAAGLQTRVDSKYLLTPARYRRFRDRLADTDGWACLEIDGRRRFSYETVYFDTPDLLTYREHRQGRRRRFKVRTRTYADSGECAFEVKTKGSRRGTVKQRLPYRPADAGRLTGEALAFLTETLQNAYGRDVPPGMAARLRTDYRRHTLVNLAETTRVTVDEDLSCIGGTGTAAARRMFLVEVKAARAGGPADRLLWGMGARPLTVSKYCLSAAVLFPWLHANPWSRALKEWFGPVRPAPAG